MPFRSPKMYSFIFGFQRLVWWPKWTPASSKSFNAIAAKCPPSCGPCDRRTLKLRRYRLLNWKRLRAPSCPYFFRSLMRASRVRKPSFFSALAQLDVVLDQRARDAEAHGAGLAGHAAAGDGREHVELVGGFGQRRAACLIWVRSASVGKNPSNGRWLM